MRQILFCTCKSFPRNTVLNTGQVKAYLHHLYPHLKVKKKKKNEPKCNILHYKSRSLISLSRTKRNTEVGMNGCKNQLPKMFPNCVSLSYFTKTNIREIRKSPKTGRSDSKRQLLYITNGVPRVTATSHD